MSKLLIKEQMNQILGWSFTTAVGIRKINGSTSFRRLVHNVERYRK